MTDTDLLGDEMYRMVSGPAPLPSTVTVDLETLTKLAARYDVPHFWQTDYKIIDKHGFERDYVGWTLHMICIPSGLMVVAYEKNEKPRPLADKLAEEG